MPRRPPLLWLTVSTAALLFFLTPSCGPADDSADGGKTRRRRVMEDAPRALTAEEARARTAARELARPAALRARAEEAARIRVARRRFLMSQEIWSAEAGRPFTENIRGYHHIRTWISGILLTSPQPDIADKLAMMLPDFRRVHDGFGTDPAKLNPGSKEQWDSWEAKSWRGYPPAQPAPATDYDAGGALVSGIATSFDLKENNRARAAADFEAAQTARIQAVLDAAEFQEDLDAVLHPPPPDAPPFTSRNPYEPTEAEITIRDELLALARESVRLRKEWQDKDWEGYSLTNPASTPRRD